jgi:hypothetical protein
MAAFLMIFVRGLRDFSLFFSLRLVEEWFEITDLANCVPHSSLELLGAHGKILTFLTSLFLKGKSPNFFLTFALPD